MQNTKQKTLTLGITAIAAFSFSAAMASQKKKEGISIEDMKTPVKFEGKYHRAQTLRLRRKVDNMGGENLRKIQSPKFESVYFETVQKKQELSEKWNEIKNASRPTGKIAAVKMLKGLTNLGSVAPLGALGKGIANGLKKSSKDEVDLKNFLNPWTIGGTVSSVVSMGYHLWGRKKLNQKIDDLEDTTQGFHKEIFSLSSSGNKANEAKVKDLNFFNGILQDPKINEKRFSLVKTAIVQKVKYLQREDDDDDEEEGEDEQEGEVE